MNQKLKIEQTKSTPGVIFDSGSGQLEISGRSIPENPEQVYLRLLEWTDAYFRGKPRELTNVVLQLEYVNSGSSKYLMEFFRLLKKYHESGKAVAIVWRYEEEDEAIYELGLHYKSSYPIPFEMEMIVV